MPGKLRADVAGLFEPPEAKERANLQKNYCGPCAGTHDEPNGPDCWAGLVRRAGRTTGGELVDELAGGSYADLQGSLAENVGVLAGRLCTGEIPDWESAMGTDSPVVPESGIEPSTGSTAWLERRLADECDRIKALLVGKNRSYGNSALDPIRIFARSDRLEQIKVRIDDKLSRIKRAPDESSEDTVTDLVGYLILYLIARGA